MLISFPNRKRGRSGGRLSRKNGLYLRDMTESYFLTTEISLEGISMIFQDAVAHTCCRHYTPEQLRAWLNRATCQRWKTLLESDLHFIAAQCREDGDLAGFASVNASGYLHSMFVRPRHQRKGVATMLLRAAEAYAAERGAETVHAEVSHTARPFFEKSGFGIVRRQTVDVDGIGMDNWLMCKKLDR